MNVIEPDDNPFQDLDQESEQEQISGQDQESDHEQESDHDQESEQEHDQESDHDHEQESEQVINLINEDLNSNTVFVISKELTGYATDIECSISTVHLEYAKRNIKNVSKRQRKKTKKLCIADIKRYFNTKQSSEQMLVSGAIVSRSTENDESNDENAKFAIVMLYVCGSKYIEIKEEQEFD